MKLTRMRKLGSQRHHGPGSDFDSQALAGDKRDRRELRRTSRQVQHAKMPQDCTGPPSAKKPYGRAGASPHQFWACTGHLLILALMG
jgi:hypothetical protein